MLGLDLRAEPLVLTLPPIEQNRYYSVQFIDAYTSEIDSDHSWIVPVSLENYPLYTGHCVTPVASGGIIPASVFRPSPGYSTRRWFDG